MTKRKSTLFFIFIEGGREENSIKIIVHKKRNCAHVDKIETPFTFGPLEEKTKDSKLTELLKKYRGEEKNITVVIE